MKTLTRQGIILNLLLVCMAAGAQPKQLTPEELGWKAYTVHSESLGPVHYVVSAVQIDRKKPLLLYLDGSGALPMFQYTQRGIGSSVPLDYRSLSEQYHVVVISKPGVPFIDSIYYDTATGYPQYPTPAEYKKRLSLDWRVEAANLVLRNVPEILSVDTDKVAILGISEGFQVGAKLISTNRSVTHAILVVGNGLNQLFDFIIQYRTDAQAGKITQEEAQYGIDSLLKVYRDIYADPASTDKEWYGHTYLRWASFAGSIPMEHILSADIPVYLVAAANDRNTTVLSTDYIALESLRLGKNHIEYKVYPYDHSLSEYITDEQGNITGARSHMREVLGEALEWLAGK